MPARIKAAKAAPTGHTIIQPDSQVRRAGSFGNGAAAGIESATMLRQ
jgi:hypothetical protein